ncbi:MAG: hypothetical protein IPP38_10005 [Bacteroidetes bacterium]|nr:hypothetical protein [Bacteroidota bacterium]
MGVYEKRGDVKIIMMDYRGALRDYEMTQLKSSALQTYLKRGISKYLLDDFAGAY